MNILESINNYIIMEGSGKANIGCAGEVYYKSYIEIIKRTAELCYELKLNDDTFDISVFFEYLLWCGYLSVNHKLAFCDFDIVNNMACNGADIMRGKSICMSNAEMLKRLYIELGYDAYLLGVYIPKSMDGEKHHVLNIKRNHLESEIENKDSIFKTIFDSYISRVIGNHAITLVNDNGYFEAYDPTNVDPVIIYPNLTGRWLGGKSHFSLRFSVTLTDIMLDEYNIEEIKKEIKEQKSVNVSLQEIKELEKELIFYIEANKAILDNFYEYIKDDLERVAYTLRK